MKRALLFLVVMLCATGFAFADESVRSLQQTLKDQGFYYGRVTGDKSGETTAAIRRYQIRKGLKVTGELNEETLGSIKSSSNSVADVSRSASKSFGVQPNSIRPDSNTRLNQSTPEPPFNEPSVPRQTNPSYSTSFYQSPPIRMNRSTIAGAQSQLMSRGYYRGRVDGKYGRETAFALRAFQASAGLPRTGRLDPQTLDALGSSDADFAYLAPPAPRGYETWMPARKLKHGKWKVKWKRYFRPFNESPDEDEQATTAPGSNPYNYDW
jgi:peptidoglycan hydrolase-like protein with peptidoglycan-binding domain